MSAPVLTIIAGPNGSGKSTLTSHARSLFQQNSIIDPDMIARSIQETLAADVSGIEAGRRALLYAHDLMKSRQSFTVETTLSGNTYLRMAEDAKRAGYIVRAILVGTTSVEINIERIKARVEKGGHNVPEADQRRRYPRALANMKRLLRNVDAVVILDNSTEAGYTLLASGSGKNVRWLDSVPEWAARLRD